MALFSVDALNPGVRPREVWAWAMYDFANSGYTTVILTAVFNTYFVSVIAQKANWSTLAWTLTLGLSNILVMLLMPAMGAWADQHAAKKKLLGVATIGCVAGMGLLSMTGVNTLALAVVGVVMSNFFYSMGETLIAAFLPELAKRETLGRVSGWGWSFGFLGGMLALGLGLVWVLSAQQRGEPATQYVPMVVLITAAIYAVSSMMTFLGLKERAVPQPSALKSGVVASLKRIHQTWREAQRYKDFIWLLACGSAYQAGIFIVIALSAVYAHDVLGFQQTETMLLIFLVNIASAVGAFAFGYAQDMMGHKRALAVTLLGWIVMSVLAMLAQGPGVFWVAALLAGVCMGSSQSAGRALAGALAPQDRLAEFFGLWSFAVRLAAVIGPASYGLVTWLTNNNMRLGMGVTTTFFALGLLLLKPINVARGIAAAQQAV